MKWQAIVLMDTQSIVIKQSRKETKSRYCLGN